MSTVSLCRHYVERHKCQICQLTFEDVPPKLDWVSHCLERVNQMGGEIQCFRDLLYNVRAIEAKAEEALALFVRKAHDLKKVDAQRDDVINCLCQKIAQLEKEFKDANTR